MSVRILGKEQEYYKQACNIQGYRMNKTEEQVFLENYDINKYERPSVAADMAVFTIMQDDTQPDNYRRLPEKKLKLLLIKRGGSPYKDMWALPGGFLKKGETIYETARRELKEETGADHAYLELCNVFSEHGRDPRGWIISQAFMALISSDISDEKSSLKVGSDAKEAGWFDVRLEKTEEKKYKKNGNIVCDIVYTLTLTKEVVLSAVIEEHKVYKDYHEIVEYRIIQSEGLAFDHAKIITCIINKLRKNVETDAKIVFDLMPEYFTLTDLQKAFEIISDKELLKPNFRRKIAEYVEETDMTMMNGGHRPSKLFKRNINAFYK